MPDPVPDRADDRQARAHWAAPGSEHDRRVRRLRFLVPAIGLALVLLLVVAPLLTRGDISFVLDREGAGRAEERLRAEATEYRGLDKDGRPFTLNAGRAVQAKTGDDVLMQDLSARLALPDGTAAVTAERGRFDQSAERVAVEGPVQVTAPDDYRLRTSDVDVDLKSRTLQSRGEVTGTLPIGTFRADKLEADLADRTVRLEGRVRLKMEGKSAK